jgi:hypothetical protein
MAVLGRTPRGGPKCGRGPNRRCRVLERGGHAVSSMGQGDVLTLRRLLPFKSPF